MNNQSNALALIKARPCRIVHCAGKLVWAFGDDDGVAGLTFQPCIFAKISCDFKHC